MRGRLSSKSDTCTEGADVYATGISVKAGVHYPGKSVNLPEGYRSREAAGWVGRGQQKPDKDRIDPYSRAERDGETGVLTFDDEADAE
jgi:hypothetical protein